MDKRSSSTNSSQNKSNKTSEIAHMFEQLKEKHLAKKQEWTQEKNSLQIELNKAHQRIRMLQSFPKEVEERYGKMKKVQLRYEELQERLNRERLEWKYDKNYLKQINERLRGDLARNICYMCKCRMGEGFHGGQHVEALLEDMEREKRQIMLAHRREKEKWINEKRMLRDKVEKFNSKVEKVHGSPLILHGSCQLSPRLSYESNRSSSEGINDFTNRSSSQDQSFHSVVNELLQNIKKIDTELDENFEKQNMYKSQNLHPNIYDSNLPYYSNDKTNFPDKTSGQNYHFTNQESIENNPYPDVSSRQQQEQYYSHVSRGTNHNMLKKVYTSKASKSLDESSLPGRSQSLLSPKTHQNLSRVPEHSKIPNNYINADKMSSNYDIPNMQYEVDDRVSMVSSTGSCSLPAFSDSGDSETTAFTTPLPFVKERGGFNQSVKDFPQKYGTMPNHLDYRENFYPTTSYLHQPLKSSSEIQMNYYGNEPKETPYYTNKSPDKQENRLQKSPYSHSPNSSDNRSTPRQRKTLSNLHQQLLFRRQQQEEEKISAGYEKQNLLNVEGSYYHRDEKTGLVKTHMSFSPSAPKKLQVFPPNVVKSVSPNNKKTAHRSSFQYQPTNMNTNPLLKPIVEQKGPEVPPKPDISIDELLQVNSISEKHKGAESYHKTTASKIGNLGKMGKTWFKKKLQSRTNQDVQQSTKLTADAKIKSSSRSFLYTDKDENVVRKNKKYKRSKTEAHDSALNYSSCEENPNEREKISKNVRLRKSKSIKPQNNLIDQEKKNKRRQSVKSEVHVPLMSMVKAKLSDDLIKTKALTKTETNRQEQKKSSKRASSVQSDKKESSVVKTTPISKSLRGKDPNDSLVYSVVSKLNEIKDENERAPKLEKPAKRMSALRGYLNQQRRKTETIFTSKREVKKSLTGKTEKQQGNGVVLRRKEKVSEDSRRWSSINLDDPKSKKSHRYKRSKTQYLSANEEEDEEEYRTPEEERL